MLLWIQRAAITIVLIFAVYVRVDGLAEPFNWYDEAITSLRVAGHTEQEVAAFASSHPSFQLGDLEQFLQVDSSTRAADALRSVATEDPQHAPLYYMMARGWAVLFGSRLDNGRLLAALASIWTLPAMYWLCLELFVHTGAFASRVPCWLGVAAMALSPYQIAFAREHREYSLWCLAIVLSCAAFLRALRGNSWQAWALYSALMTLSIYSHLLSVAVLAACGVWLIVRERFRLTRVVWSFAAASAIAGVAAIPWAVVLLNKREAAQNSLGWAQSYARGSFNFGFSIQPVLHVFDVSFWDVIDVGAGLPSTRLRLMFYQIGPLLFLGALWWFRRQGRQAAGFAFALVCSTSIAFFCWDYLMGSSPGWAIRYAMPSNLGWLLAATFLLGVLVTEPGRWLGLRRVLAGLFFVVAAISAEYIHESRSTFAKAVVDHGENAELLNSNSKIVLVTDDFVGSILTLLPSVRPDLRVVWRPRCFSCPLVLTPVVEVPSLPAGFQTILYFRSWVNVGEDPAIRALTLDEFHDPRFHSESVMLPTGKSSNSLFLLTAIP